MAQTGNDTELGLGEATERAGQADSQGQDYREEDTEGRRQPYTGHL